MADKKKAKSDISIAQAVYLTVPKGATGSMVAKFDGKTVVLTILLTTIPNLPSKIALEIPWGQVYGMGKKAGLCGKRKQEAKT